MLTAPTAAHRAESQETSNNSVVHLCEPLLTTMLLLLLLRCCCSRPTTTGLLINVIIKMLTHRHFLGLRRQSAPSRAQLGAWSKAHPGTCLHAGTPSNLALPARKRRARQSMPAAHEHSCLMIKGLMLMTNDQGFDALLKHTRP
jgi:hypothetical protein